MQRLHVISGLTVNSPKEAFRHIAFNVGARTGIEPSKLYDALCILEKQDRSGIGDGVAIPHGKLPFLTHPVIAVARLNRAVDFEAVDRVPVDLVFVVLSPEDDGPLHLKRLASVSRMARDKAFCERLRGSTSEDAVRAVLMDSEMNAANAKAA